MRQHIVNLAMKFIGIPYIWGGASPRIGFDCSGFVIWIYQVFGLLPSGDWTAQGLYDYFKRDLIEDMEPGDLVYYGKDFNKITHVMIYVGKMNGQAMVVGASGGDSKCTTDSEALRRDAKVKIKPLQYRGDHLGYTNIRFD